MSRGRAGPHPSGYGYGSSTGWVIRPVLGLAERAMLAETGFWLVVSLGSGMATEEPRLADHVVSWVLRGTHWMAQRMAERVRTQCGQARAAAEAAGPVPGPP